MKWLSVLAVAGLCAACNSSNTGTTTPPADATGGTARAAAAAAASTSPAAEKAPSYREVTLPAGTTLHLSMQTAVASDSSKVEEPVRAEVKSPVTINGEMVVPAGAEVSGIVTDVQQSGRVKGRARVAYKFTSLRAHGESYEIKTAPIAEEARATKGKDARNIAIGAGAGAALGAIFGGGGGAVKGAAIGGAGGAGYDLATRGEEVHIGPGAAVTTRLTAPVTLRLKI